LDFYNLHLRSFIITKFIELYNHMKPVLLIIAPNQFRDEELFETKEELENAGLATVIASKQKGTCIGKLGGKAEATISIEDIQTKDYEAVAFIGGPGSEVYFNDRKAHDIAWEMYADRKIVGAICIAPTILANAGILKDKKATVFADGAEQLKSGGAIYTAEAVTKDGLIVTGNGPASSRAFGKTLAASIQHPEKE
jgi:protease I